MRLTEVESEEHRLMQEKIERVLSRGNFICTALIVTNVVAFTCYLGVK